MQKNELLQASQTSTLEELDPSEKTKASFSSGAFMASVIVSCTCLAEES